MRIFVVVETRFLLCHLEVDDIWWNLEEVFPIPDIQRSESGSSRILNTIYFLLDRRVIEGVEVSEIGIVVCTRMRF